MEEQYRNMKEVLDRHPEVAEQAAEVYRRAGLDPRIVPVRGGTDGSRLSEMGLPTPNLSTGMHNFHSPLEYTCLEEMQTAVDVLVELGCGGAARVPCELLGDQLIDAEPCQVLAERAA